MNNINENFEDKINLLKNKIEDIVSMVDKKPDFYNNIFFEKNNKPIPLNLVNTKYINAKIVEEAKKNKKEKFEEKHLNNLAYQLNEPLYIYSLPSSDDSGGEESNKIKQNNFKSICDEIIDTKYLELINLDNEGDEEVKHFPNNILPILMFKCIPSLSSIDNILKFCSFKLGIKPYEIKKVFFKELKSDIFLVKFYSIKDALKAKLNFNKDFNEEFNVKFHLCYDKRELKDTKWYCVLFRRKINKDKNYTFKDIIKDIYEEINCPKKIITIDTDDNIYKIYENYFYSAIKVDNLNVALNLCIKYNKYNNLKVHLHNLTYHNSKKLFPEVLNQKDFIKEKPLLLNKDPQAEIVNKLFGKPKKKKIK